MRCLREARPHVEGLTSREADGALSPSETMGAVFNLAAPRPPEADGGGREVVREVRT